MFIGEGPGSDEDVRAEPFIGACGRILNANLTKAGLSRDEVRVSNCIRCRPPNNDAPSFRDAIPCSCFLSKEIQEIKPKILVPLGKVALQALLGSPTAKITEAHGNPLNVEVAGHKCILFPMWHPSYVLRNDYLSATYQDTFKKLRELAETGVVASDEGEYLALTDPVKCIAALKKMQEDNKLTAFDLETSGLEAFSKDQRIACLSFANHSKKGYCVPLYVNCSKVFEVPDEIKALGWTFEQWREVIDASCAFLKSDVPKLGQNVKFDENWIFSYLGIEVKNVKYDSMLAHYAIDENSTHALKALVMKYTNMGSYDGGLELYKEQHGIKGRYDLIPFEQLGKYAAMDSVATLRVHRAVKKLVEDDGPDTVNLAYNVLPRYKAVLHRLERRGAYIDVPFSQELHKEIGNRITDNYDKLRSIPAVRKFIREKTAENKKFEFSVNSPKQMIELMFERLGHEPIKATKSTRKLPKEQQTPATDKETLQYFVTENQCEVSAAVLGLRLDEKLQSAFVEKLLTKALNCKEGPFVHGNVNLHVVRTGRVSMSDPNLQQVPAKGSGVVKRMFTSRFGDKGCILQSDFSQIELRFLAALSGDRTMIQAYKDERDIHLLTTTKIFGCTEKDWLKRDEAKDPSAKKERVIAKRINFGVVYGIGAEGIENLLRSEGIRVTRDEAKSYIEKFFEAYPGVRRWIDESHRTLKRDGFLRSMFGRYRRLPTVNSRDEEAVARAMRQGTNFLIQSPASGDMTLTALVLIDAALRKRKMKSIPILTIHDSIILDCLISEADRAAKIVKKVMENLHIYGPRIWGDGVDFSLLTVVPIKVDIEVGVNWRDGVKLKTTAVEAIEESKKVRAKMDDEEDTEKMKLELAEEVDTQEKEDQEEDVKAAMKRKKYEAA